MPGNVIDAVAEALEYETFNCTPGFQISRLSVQQGGHEVVLDAHVRLPEDLRSYCAQYGESGPALSGIQFNAVPPRLAWTLTLKATRQYHSASFETARMPKIGDQGHKLIWGHRNH